MAPQAAGCLLAATMLVAVPAGADTARAESGPQPASAQRLKIDAVTMRKVRAYKKYKRRLARQEKRARTAIGFARRQIGKPYRWGATGPGAYDCSGLVMKSWRKAGVKLPRVTHSQYRAVRRKVSLRSLRPGDLVFFRGRAHVGMAVSKNRFIHAPSSGSRVRINKLSRYRKRQFAGAVRPGAPAVRKWPDSIPRLSRRLDEVKQQEAAASTTRPAQSATQSAEQSANSESDAPVQNSPVTSPQNEAPPGQSQSQAPPGPTPTSPKPVSPPGSSDPVPDTTSPSGRESG